VFLFSPENFGEMRKIKIKRAHSVVMFFFFQKDRQISKKENL
jgi:hypothetical protein